MFAVFELSSNISFSDQKFLKAGLDLRAKSGRQVNGRLRSFLNQNGSLNGSAMQSDWFPSVVSDVFISHSHQDEKTALSLAGWLSSNFGLRPFIDSSVWGNCNDLLRIIDDEYCWREESRTFDYDKRNGSTSHVHMMLTTALAQMIDKTECMIALKTSNYITAEGATQRTSSPWIFMELGMMRLVRRRIPSRGLVKKAEAILREHDKDLRIEYLVDLESMRSIEADTLNKWQRICDDSNLRASETLDVLYAITST